MILPDILQWTAAVFILVGYICYAKKLIWGPALSAIGSAGFVIWAFGISAYGILVLNVVLMLVNAWALYRWNNEQKNPTT